MRIEPLKKKTAVNSTTVPTQAKKTINDTWKNADHQIETSNSAMYTDLNPMICWMIHTTK